MDPRLNNLILTFLFPSDRKGLDFDTYNNFATGVIKGNYNEKADILLQMIATGTSSDEEKLREVSDMNYFTCERYLLWCIGTVKVQSVY